MVKVYNLETDTEMIFGDNVKPEEAVKLAYAMEKSLMTAVACRGMQALEGIKVHEGKYFVTCGNWTTRKRGLTPIQK